MQWLPQPRHDRENQRHNRGARGSGKLQRKALKPASALWIHLSSKAHLRERGLARKEGAVVVNEAPVEAIPRSSHQGLAF